VVADWDPSGNLSFTANEHYWQPDKPYADRLEYVIVADDTQRIQQLRTGQLSAIEQVSPASLAELEADPGVTVSQLGSWAVEQVFFNTLDAHFADRQVRRAIALALDRAGITAAVTFGTAEPLDTLIPPTIQYSADVEALDADPAA